LAIVVAVVNESALEDGLDDDDDDEDAVVDEAPLEDGLDDDDDDTAAEVLDVADVDRAIRGADGSSAMTKVDMMDRMRAGDRHNENVTLLWKKRRGDLPRYTINPQAEVYNSRANTLEQGR